LTPGEDEDMEERLTFGKECVHGKKSNVEKGLWGKIGKKVGWKKCS